MSDELLHAMSTAPWMRIDRFNEIFGMVYRPASSQEQDGQWLDINVRRHVARSLEALGFFEVDYASRRVYLCPPTMVLLPDTGTPCALLTGARVPETLTRLRKVVGQAGKQACLLQQAQGRGNINMPHRIVVEAIDKDTLAGIGKEASIDHDLDEPAAWKLANLSATISDISSGLAFSPRQEPNWPRRVFREGRLRFSRAHANPEAELWLAEYRNPITKQHHHWLWRGYSTAEVERDWGRYVTLVAQGRNVLLYGERSRELAVPATTPLPALLTRAAALSSGTLPEVCTTDHAVAAIPAGHPMLVYQDVPSAIAEMIASKLDQRLIPVTPKDSVYSND